MAFNKISAPSVPSFQDVISQLHDINSKRLSNEQQRLSNYETGETQQSRIAQAIAANQLAALQATQGQRLVAPMTDLQLAQTESAGKVLPYSVQQQIAEAVKGTAAANLATKYPLLGLTGDLPKFGAIQMLRDQQGATDPVAGAPVQPQVQNVAQAIMGKPDVISPMMQGVDGYEQVIGMTQPAPVAPAALPAQNGMSGMGGFNLNTPGGMADFMEQSMFAQQMKDIALAKRYSILSTPYKNMTVDQQREAIATAAGWGFSKDQATQFLINGGTMEQLRGVAQQNGVDVDSAMPLNAPTSATLTADQKALGREAELEYMAPKINDAMAPYATRFAGMSLKQIADAASGQNPQQLGQYLGARALQPEMAAIRNTIAGAESGIEAIKMVKELMYGKLRDAELTMTPETFEAMQSFIDDTIKGAFEARRKATYNVGKKDGSGKIGDKVMGGGAKDDPLGIL